MPDAAGRLAAVVLCVIGMAALDHGLPWLWELVAADRHSGNGVDAFLANARARSRFLAVGEAVGVTALLVAALRLSFPCGLHVDRQPWVLLLVAALTAGRSFLGVGEGFTASFGVLLAVCACVALVIYGYLPKASR